MKTAKKISVSKAQTTLEFLLAFLAYLGFLLVLLSAGADAGKKAEKTAAAASEESKARAECFFASFFALDGKNSAMDVGKNFSELSGIAKKCRKAKTRFGAEIVVEENDFKPV